VPAAARLFRRHSLAVIFLLLACLLLACVLLAPPTRAGGPRYVAGIEYFNSGTAGTPLTWAQGAISYYTDQGDLSTQLPGPSADAFVAAAFARWTSISTAAISATRAGHLAEDVNGTNVTVNPDSTISLPVDIQPSATNEPVAVVYDADGSVTDALIGQGASDPSFCSSYSVLGGPDNLSPDANLVHALVVLNGNCAQTATQLPDLQYHLVRTLGRVLGLDWSQVNLNVVTGNPTPTTPDYPGFSVMHAVDPTFCNPIAQCYPAAVDPAQPKMDDQAALSRLYPITAQNQANFPGKQIFSTTTVRIHGTVYFVDSTGQSAQPMQGVNVVGRWIDPTTEAPSGTYAAASVSGFLFTGNAGNPATGSTDANGDSYDEFGSNDPTLEGFFDLGGLQIPNGTSPAQFQLSVEAVDPIWSAGMQPYGNWQVLPSGNTRVFVNANLGQDVHQDILMVSSAVATPNSFGPTSYASPAAVPASGDWMGTLSPYGDTDYFTFAAQANRTLSLSATALNQSGAPSEQKAQPVIGIWSLAAPQTDSATVSVPALNTVFLGETRLDATINASTNFRVAIADFRGDGRPDYRYHAHVFYADGVTPARASTAGGTPLAIQGLGFSSGDAVTVGTASATALSASPNQILLTAPATADSVQSIALSDPSTGSSSAMTAVLTFGAGPTDIIKLVAGASQAVPVGGQAASPIIVQALAPDGMTPVAGASVFFTAAPAAALSACGGTSSCTVLTNQSGFASTYATVLTASVSTITAELAPASYNPPQEAQATLFGTSTALDIALTPQTVWLAQNATLSLPLTARVLSNGSPMPGRLVDFLVLKGSALLNASSLTAAVTADANGIASSTLQISAAAGDVLVSACVKNQPVDSPCLSFRATMVPTIALQLQPVSGNPQLVPATQAFAPVAVEVTDSTGVHPVLGASVTFQSVVARLPANLPAVWIGDTGISGNPMPVILSSSQISVLSDGNGLAAFQPTAGGVGGAVAILGSSSAGASSLPFTLQSIATSQGPISQPNVIPVGTDLRPGPEER
jgi:IPT/TIG domain